MPKTPFTYELNQDVLFKHPKVGEFGPGTVRKRYRTMFLRHRYVVECEEMLSDIFQPHKRRARTKHYDVPEKDVTPVEEA